LKTALSTEWSFVAFEFKTCAGHDSSGQEDLRMADHYWLTENQLERIKPYFPRSHGKPRVDDRRVISGIIHVIRNGLRWRDAPEVYGPHKTIYNRFVRWSRMGVFDCILSGLAACEEEPDIVMIDATHLKAHRTACSLVKKGSSATNWPNERRPELQTSCIVRQPRKTVGSVFERRLAIGPCWSKAGISGDTECQRPDRRQRL
jgi:putative transposase